MIAQFKVDGKVYTLDRFTLASGVILKRHYGLADLEELNKQDPETILGLLVLAIMKEDGLSRDAAHAIAEDIDIAEIEPGPDTEAAGDAAPLGDADAGTSIRAKSGNSAKRRKTPGTPA